MHKPLHSYEGLVNEISEITGLDAEIVKQKVWAEALAVGSNVSDDAASAGIEPHVYSEAMEALYRSTHAFLIETMVESCRPGKAQVLAVIAARIQTHLGTRSGWPARVLMLGDGSGSDTIELYKQFKNALEFFYFDVPESRTFECAIRRFALHDTRAQIVTNFDELPPDYFDVLISLEVLEHLPDPLNAIGTMRSLLKPGGVCLITESFGGVRPQFPTHLACNLKYANQTPLLFLKEKLLLTFFNRDPQLRFRPLEFTKVPEVSWRDRSYVYHVCHGERSYLKTVLKVLLGSLRTPKAGGR